MFGWYGHFTSKQIKWNEKRSNIINLILFVSNFADTFYSQKEGKNQRVHFVAVIAAKIA